MPVADGADQFVNLGKVREALEQLTVNFTLELAQNDWFVPTPWPADVSIEIAVCDSLVRAGFEIVAAGDALMADPADPQVVAACASALLQAFAVVVKDTLSRIDQLEST